ncbi:hypothetical protein AgCh_017296 [Apium graveolens]
MQGLKAPTKKQKYCKILEKKLSTPIDSLQPVSGMTRTRVSPGDELRSKSHFQLKLYKRPFGYPSDEDASKPTGRAYLRRDMLRGAESAWSRKDASRRYGRVNVYESAWQMKSMVMDALGRALSSRTCPGKACMKRSNGGTRLALGVNRGYTCVRKSREIAVAECYPCAGRCTIREVLRLRTSLGPSRLGLIVGHS